MKNDDVEDMIAEAITWCRNKEKIFLESWCKEAHLKEPIGYSYEHGKGFTIYTNYPGWLIGKGGIIYNKYIEILHKDFNKNDTVKFVEIKYGGFVNIIKEMT